ncbi:MAG: glycosyltransferase [Methanotrichaceae archaeon]
MTKYKGKARRAETSLRILQINTFDMHGGAAKVAFNLFRSYRDLGYHSSLAVGLKKSINPEVMQIPTDIGSNYWENLWLKAGVVLAKKYPNRINNPCHVERFLRILGDPVILLNYLTGRENFEFPGTAHIFKFIENEPDIIHCHNLHGNYFDLRQIPKICKETPLILTLHDAWMLGGHCAHSFECELWKTGCGNCPDLAISPAIRRDATAYNWRRKRDIYAKSRLYVATPSQWLMNKVKNSMLAPAIIDSRVIPNGVDLEIFHPYDMIAARKEIGLPQDAKILLFAASGIRKNIWKDYDTLQKAVSLVGKSSYERDVLFVTLGESAPKEKIGTVEVRFVPYQLDSSLVARYYQAADVYIHAVRAETFGNTLVEAMSCGTPVVATSVGSIPELIDESLTGFLVPQGDPVEMAQRIIELLSNEELRYKMGRDAAEAARHKFSLDRQVEAYLNWYKEILINFEQIKVGNP